MPAFRYLPGYSRIYADRSLLVEPGDVVDWPEAPGDGQWEPVDPPSDDDKKTDDGDQATTPPDEPETTAQAPDASAEASASKKTTRRAAPAQNTEE